MAINKQHILNVHICYICKYNGADDIGRDHCNVFCLSFGLNFQECVPHI